MLDTTEHARAALEFYGSTANLTSTYWGAYLTVSAAIIGYTIAAQTPPARRLRIALTVGFLLFAIANLPALVNKHSLHAAAAAEVVAAVRAADGQWPQSPQLRGKTHTVCSSLRATVMPIDCLHATSGRTAFWFHIILDVVVLAAIWRDVLWKRTATT